MTRGDVRAVDTRAPCPGAAAWPDAPVATEADEALQSVCLAAAQADHQVAGRRDGGHQGLPGAARQVGSDFQSVPVMLSTVLAPAA
jgi:hypothetical protein